MDEEKLRACPEKLDFGDTKISHHNGLASAGSEGF
jgi:hypothetical protein